MRRSTILVLAAFTLFATQVFAKSKPVEDAVELGSYDDFQVLVVELRSEMKIGGRYEYLRGMDRDNVNRRLDAMAQILQASGSVAETPSDERAALLADQEAVNDLLAKFADNRVICTHEAPIGSLIPRKKCRTLRQIETARSRSKGQLMDTQRDAALGGE